jgi:hypothetical protein
MAKIIETSIDTLVPDNRNYNKGTQYGQRLIEKSLSEFGAGRSILIDKHDRIIAGNKTVENFGAIGMDKVLIVETDGQTLVAVKRKDIDLDSPKGREMALADNATGKANLDLDADLILEDAERLGFDALDWVPDLSTDDGNEDDKGKGGKKSISTKLVVECGDVSRLELLFNELQERGFQCTLE